MGRLISLALFVAGFWGWRWAARTVFGRLFRLSLVVGGCSLVASRAAYAAPPSGYSSSYMVSFNGAAMSGSWVVTWDDSAGYWAWHTADWKDYIYVTAPGPGGNTIGFQFYHLFPKAPDGEFYTPGVSAFPGGPWLCSGVEDQDFYYDQSDPAGVNTISGYPNVFPAAALVGTPVVSSSGMMAASVFLGYEDNLWRGSNGSPYVMVPSAFFQAAPGVATSSVPPASFTDQGHPGTNGWDSADAAWLNDNTAILPAGATIAVTSYWDSVNHTQSGTPYVGGTAVHYQSGQINLAGFGGYATAGVDLVQANFASRAIHGTVYEWSTSSSQWLGHTVTVNAVRLEKVPNGKTDHGTLVVSVEPDSRKPYLEWRRDSDGYVTRIYTQGNAGASSTGALQSPNPQLGPILGYYGDGVTWRSDLFAEPNVTCIRLGWSGPWPAPGLPAPVVDAGGDAATRLTSGIAGDGTTANPSIVDRIMGDASFKRPTFLPIDEGGLTAAADANGALADFESVYSFFSLSGSDYMADVRMPLPNGATGPLLMKWSDLMLAIFAAPQKAMTYWPGFCTAMRWFTGLWLVWGLVNFIMAYVAWAMAIRNPERVITPAHLEQEV